MVQRVGFSLFEAEVDHLANVRHRLVDGLAVRVAAPELWAAHDVDAVFVLLDEDGEMELAARGHAGACLRRY